MKLKLAEGLSLPLDTVTEKLCWLGRTGSGKTYGAMKLAELMLEAGAQIGVLDPVGVWRALRVPAEKDGTSFEVVVFGGLYGDLPLEPQAGELIADLVVDRGLSFVLDVSQFIPSEQQRFVRAFADRFFHRKKSAPSAVHLFIEEAQEFIPENPSGEEAKTLGVMQRLWKLGRNFGIGGSLISQRPQEISKKALNMSGTMFAFQMTGPQERKTVRAWVADHGVATDIESVLQTLRTGEPHVESPTFLEISKSVRILPRVTADLSSTPKVGASTAAKRPLTPIDVERLKESMAATIEKAKADDPRELRKQIAELKRQVAQGVAQANTKSEPIRQPVKTVEKFVLKDGQLARAEKILTRYEEATEKLAVVFEGYAVSIAQPFAEVAKEIAAAITSTRAPQHNPNATMTPRVGAVPQRQPSLPSPHGRRVVPAATTSRPASVHPSSNGHRPDGEVGKSGLRRMLIALAQRPQGLTKRQLGLRAGLSSRTGTFANYLSKGRTSAWIDGAAQLRITDTGLAALGEFEPLPEGRGLYLHWLSALGESGAARMLQALVEAWPNTMTKEALGDAASLSHSTGTFANYLSRLRGLELIDGKGDLKASDELCES